MVDSGNLTVGHGMMVLAAADAARAGLAASSIAMESRETINPGLGEEALRARLEAAL